jgi:hypothetical protein
MNDRNRIIGMVLVVGLLTALAFPVQGQSKRTVTRIRFKRGGSSATVKGQLSSGRLEQIFVVGAQSGQELYLQIRARTSDGLDFALIQLHDPFGRPLGSSQDDLSVRLKHTGDYRIEVTPPGSFYRENVKGYKRLQFTLFVRIP